MDNGIDPVNEKDPGDEEAAYSGHGPEFVSFGSKPQKDNRKEVNGACEKEKREVEHSIKSIVPGENISDREQKGRTKIDPHEKAQKRRTAGL